MSQVVEHTESQNRPYALDESARAMGFASVTTIEDDLGRSGSGSIERPGFQKLVASVCVGAILCIGIGGVCVDKAVAAAILEAVSEHAVEAAIRAAQQTSRAGDDVRRALACELGEARYDASLAASRYEVVDPTKRLVASELEARWNAALERYRPPREGLQKS